MTRPLRTDEPGASYHLTARGNNREAIYHSDLDRFDFLKLLERVTSRHDWSCRAYCLMTNH